MNMSKGFYGGKTGVIELNRDNFSIKNLQEPMSFNKKKHCLLIIYAVWCPHCSDPDFRKNVSGSAKILGKMGIPTFALNGAHPDLEDVASNMNVQSFPTVRYVSPDNKHVDYDKGSREVNDLVSFVVENAKNHEKRKSKQKMSRKSSRSKSPSKKPSRKTSSRSSTTKKEKTSKPVKRAKSPQKKK